VRLTAAGVSGYDRALPPGRLRYLWDMTDPELLALVLLGRDAPYGAEAEGVNASTVLCPPNPQEALSASSIRRGRGAPATTSTAAVPG
jgi:hypothetical protein